MCCYFLIQLHLNNLFICAELSVFKSNLIIHSFIHSGYFYSASSSPLLLRSASDTARILCRSFTSKHHRQLRVEGLVSTWRLERDSNPRPYGRKASTQPMRHHVPQLLD